MFGEYKYIFHVHTEYSPDSDVKLYRLYKLLKKNNIFGIVITDHNTIEGAVKFNKTYGHDIHVIIGEEIMTTEGEVVGLFLNENIPKGLTPIEAIKRIKEQNGIIYVPHPFDTKRQRTCLKESIIRKFSNYIDIIEVFNGRCIKSSDIDKGILLNSMLNKIGIIGSDAHTYYELKFNHMLLNKKITRENIHSELRCAKVSNKKINRIIHQYTKLIRIKKLILKGKYYEVFNLIYRSCKKSLFKVSK